MSHCVRTSDQQMLKANLIAIAMECLRVSRRHDAIGVLLGGCDAHCARLQPLPPAEPQLSDRSRRPSAVRPSVWLWVRPLSVRPLSVRPLSVIAIRTARLTLRCAS